MPVERGRHRIAGGVKLPRASRGAAVAAGLARALAMGLAVGLAVGWPGSVRAAPSAGVPTLAAGPTAEGKFETWIDRLLDGGSRTSHHLIDGREEIELRLPEGMEIPLGALVRVSGQAIEDGIMSVTGFEVLEFPPQKLIDPERRDPRRIATIIVFWNNQGLQNVPARDQMFLDDRSTNVFYGENSYGKDMMAGNVFGPYQIEMPATCNTSFIAEQAKERFREKGHDEDDYIQFMFHFEGGISCSFSGRASLGSPDLPAAHSFYNNSFGCVVRNQELAHNYGLSHTRRFTCEGGGQDCLPPASVPSNYPSNLEYGSPYDPMGRGCFHMNAVHKTKMKWLEECNVVTATSDGVFNLSPLELPCNGTQTIRFPTSDGRYYWLEFRGPHGAFDASLQTILLHVGTETANTPFLVYAGDQGRFSQGDSWTSPDGEVSFTVTSLAASGALIDLTFPNGGGDGAAPTCLDGAEPIMDGGAIGSLECAAEPFPLDTEPPTAEITFPLNNDYFEPGSDFTISALGMDNRQITELELYLDGQPVRKVFTNPGEWNVVAIPQGVYELGVIAWDGPNNGLSEGVRIYVGEDPPGGGTAGTGGSTDTAGSTGTTGATTDTDGDTNTDTDTDGTTPDDLPATGDNGTCACTTRTGPDPGLVFGALGWVCGLRIRRRVG